MNGYVYGMMLVAILVVASMLIEGVATVTKNFELRIISQFGAFLMSIGLVLAGGVYFTHSLLAWDWSW